MSPAEADGLFAAVSGGSNVVSAATALGLPLDDVLECIHEREGDYMAALRRVPRRILVTSNNPTHWPK